MSDTVATDRLVVGKIAGCHGIKGWVKVHSYTDPRENFLEFGSWTIQRRGASEPIEFDVGRSQGKTLIAHIKGVDDRTAAEAYLGLEVSVDAASLPQLESGDFYWRQLQGLQVWCEEQSEQVLLGTVDYLIETGANDVLVVKACEGSIDERERLIPYLPGDVVTRVDLEAQRIEVDWFLNE